MPGHRERRLAVHAADPGEPERIVFQLVPAEERLERQAAPDRAHHAAVLRRDPVERLDRLEPARAHHVLHDESRIAGNVLAHVPDQHARIDVVGGARRRIDDHRELPALVELLGRLRVRGGRAGRERGARRQRRRSRGDTRFA